MNIKDKLNEIRARLLELVADGDMDTHYPKRGEPIILTGNEALQLLIVLRMIKNARIENPELFHAEQLPT